MAAICICIPTRNRPGLVELTLASVLAQTERDFRVLVSDDASDRGAARTVESHVGALGDPRVSYVYHAENLQEYDHGRFLFAQCTERFFAILHDDDLWEPTFLRKAVDALSKDDSLAFVTTNQYIIDGRGVRQEDMTRAYQRRMGRDRYQEGPLDILEPLLTHSVFGLSSTLFRRTALCGSGLVDPELHGNGVFDLNLFIRLGERGNRAYFLPECLAAYRVHDEQLTSSVEGGGFKPHFLETFMAVLGKRKFAGRPEIERRRQLSAAYHNYAVLRFFSGDRSGMYRYLAKCVRTAPWRWRNWAYAALALFPFLVRPVFRRRVEG